MTYKSSVDLIDEALGRQLKQVTSFLRICGPYQTTVLAGQLHITPFDTITATTTTTTTTATIGTTVTVLSFVVHFAYLSEMLQVRASLQEKICEN